MISAHCPSMRISFEAQDGNVVSIAGGCVCCSYGSDLIAALMQLESLQPRVDHVLIETSGVALRGRWRARLRCCQALRSMPS